jgi:hypothetical protein
MQGLEFWKNPANHYAVLDIHYTADPEKRDPAFQAALEATLPRHQYLREYERNWQTFEGLPVYPNFRRDIHIAPRPIEAHLGLPLLLGFDFGLTPACVLGQLQGNSLKILHEWVTQNEGIKTFGSMVRGQLRMLYPEWHDMNKDILVFIDPAGFQRAQTDMRTCAQELEESCGFKHIQPGPVTWESRRSSVEHFLMQISRDAAGLEVNESTCPLIIEGFSGGYRYSDSQSDVESNQPRPIKNHYSHPHDALQYLAHGALQNIPDMVSQISIPAPAYSFAPTTTQQGVLNYGRRLKV